MENKSYKKMHRTVSTTDRQERFLIDKSIEYGTNPSRYIKALVNVAIEMNKDLELKRTLDELTKEALSYISLNQLGDKKC